MRKLYNEFFYVPKHAKIREKVMLTRVVMTVAVMVMCLLAMGLTAYAYFTCDVTSEYNTIKTATFKTSITVTDPDGNEVKLMTSNYRSFETSDLVPGVLYTVKIGELKPQSTAQTGFVVIKADGKTYHTAQLGVDEKAKGGKTLGLEFELVMTDEAKVTFVAHWGTSSQYSAYKYNSEYIVNGGLAKLVVNDVLEPPVINTENGDDSEGDGSDGDDSEEGKETPTPPEEQGEDLPEQTQPEQTEPDGEETEQTDIEQTDIEQTDIEQTDTEEPAKTQEGTDTELAE